MSTEITEARVQGYRSTIEILLQQKGSVLADTFRMETQKSRFEYFDQVASTAAQEKTTRHGDTPLMNTPHDRRRVALRDFEWADLIDKVDKLKTIASFESPYSMNAAFALGRSQDDVMIAQFFATAATGETGGGTATFPAANQIAVNYVESGTAVNSGLTIAKLREARRLLRSFEVILKDPNDPVYLALTSTQMQDLLRTTEITNIDYNVVRALVQGDIDSFMGFKFREIERLAVDANDYRRIPVYQKSGMLRTVAQEITARITERADKSYSTQVFASSSFGAVRMQENKIVEIKCSET